MPNIIGILTSLFGLLGAWFLWSSITVNYMLGFVFLLVIAIFFGLKVIQHYDNTSEYRVNNKYTWLELTSVVFATGLVIILSGHMLI